MEDAIPEKKSNKKIYHIPRVPVAILRPIPRHGCHAIRITLEIGVWRIPEKPRQHNKPQTEDVYHASQGRRRDMQMIFCRMWIYFPLAVCVVRSGGGGRPRQNGRWGVACERKGSASSATHARRLCQTPVVSGFMREWYFLTPRGSMLVEGLLYLCLCGLRRLHWPLSCRRYLRWK